jgi:hypothetical protein
VLASTKSKGWTAAPDWPAMCRDVETALQAGCALRVVVEGPRPRGIGEEWNHESAAREEGITYAGLRLTCIEAAALPLHQQAMLESHPLPPFSIPSSNPGSFQVLAPSPTFHSK